MPSTIDNLKAMATFIDRYGIHTGDQFAAPGPCAPLDICALAFIIAERCAPPAEFFTDEIASIRLIECSAPAMQTIRAISAALDSQPPVDRIDRGVEVPNYIDHVSNWTATPAIGEKAPPSTSEVIGRILRAADKADQLAAADLPHAA